MVDEAVLNAAPENELIRNTMKKADLLLNSYKNPVCSVSGGSDSDVMLDLLERVRGNRKVTYDLLSGREHCALCTGEPVSDHTRRKRAYGAK